jgi:hypothetical protein
LVADVVGLVGIFGVLAVLGVVFGVVSEAVETVEALVEVEQEPVADSDSLVEHLLRQLPLPAVLQLLVLH